MPYNQNIPQPNDPLSVSQGQLLDNFLTINTLVDVNHVSFNLADQGKHKWVSMPNQVAAPNTLATEVAIFGLTSAETGDIELNVRRQNNGTTIPFTERDGTTAGWTMLPSGLLIKWRTDTITGAQTINANAFGKAFTTLYHVMVCNGDTAIGNNTYVMGGAIAALTFNVTVSSRTVPGTNATANVRWLAIGV